MKKKKSCRGCIWYDECGSEESCEYYDPSNPRESDNKDARRYRKDAAEKIREYENLIKEQNS